MRKDAAVPTRMDSNPAARQEIDYSPKELTLREQVFMGLKFVAVAGAIFALIWFLER